MEFTPRMKQILQVLLREKEAISVQTLAEQVGVSKRTIQRELESIDYYL
ncbi:MAG: helix-turn-helix domain-containing protein, partial [Dorea sp.]